LRETRQTNSVPNDKSALKSSKQIWQSRPLQKRFFSLPRKGIAVDLPSTTQLRQYGELPSVESQRLLDMVQVNCSAVLHLTRLFFRRWSRVGEAIPDRGLDVAFQAVPYISTYAATKVFDLFLAEGLAEEMKPYDIRVCALCPGTTTSEFHEVAGHPPRGRRRSETAEKVSQTGLRALASGKSTLSPASPIT